VLGLLATLLWGATANGQEGGAGKLRHAVLFDELLDGQKQPSSVAANTLVQTLLAQGVIFVDEEQARKIRSVTDAGTLIEGKISEVITALDADVIIAGICKINSIADKKVGDTTLTRCDADIELRVIAVDTGEILAAVNVRGEALGLNQRQAASDSAAKAAKEASQAVLTAVAKKASGPKRVEISIAGTSNVMWTEQIRTSLAAVQGVTDVQVLQAGRAMTKLAVEMTGGSSRTLAVALQSIPELGLEVWGYTNSAIKADFSPAAALDMPLLALAFENKTGKAKYDWVGKTLSETFLVELGNCQFLDPGEAALKRPPAVEAKTLTAAAKEFGFDEGKTLVLDGAFSADGEKLKFDVSLLAAASGRPVMTAQAACLPQDLSDCAIKVAAEISQGLLANIQAKRKLFGKTLSDKQVKLAAEAGAAPGKPLEVAATDLANIFPSRLGRYVDKPFGTITLKNTGDEKITDLVASVQLSGFMAAPLDLRHGELAAGAAVELPVKAVLTKESLSNLEENRPTVLTVRYTYRVGDFQVEQSSNHSLVVYDRNSVAWHEPTSVAAFVAAKDDEVRKAALAGGAPPEALKNNALFQPVRVHSLIARAGVRYVPDAVNPYGKEALDYVQYPGETLGLGTGDCDDLAVAYASLLEAIGIRSAILLTPGHVLVAVDTGVPASRSQTLTADRSALLMRDGTAWIPVETTLVNGTFAEAWTAGAKELASWTDKEKVTVVDVRQAWADYPPVNLYAGKVERTSWEQVAGAELLSDVQQQLNAMEESRKAAVTAAMAQVDSELAAKGSTPELVARKAVLLAGEGKTAEARALLEESARKGGGGSALNNLGNLLAQENQLDEAIATYEKAIEKTPDKAEIHLNAGILLFMKERYDEALDHMIQAIELGAEPEVAALGRLGIGPAGGEAKGAAGTAKARGLADLARDALKKKQKPIPADMGSGEGRKASEAGKQVKLSDYLYWL
jgi:tetratricopeptide (TPR) repeat protein/TolB-like protein